MTTYSVLYYNHDSWAAQDQSHNLSLEEVWPWILSYHILRGYSEYKVLDFTSKKLVLECSKEYLKNEKDSAKWVKSILHDYESRIQLNQFKKTQIGKSEIEL